MVWKHCGYGDAQNLPRYNFENSISASDPVKNKGAGAKKEKNVTNSDTKERGCGF
jgi:hypothetical protein